MENIPANALVVASNKLFELITPLSLGELRLMDFLVAHLDPREDYSFEQSDHHPPPVKASVKDFCETFDVEPKHAYDAILQAFRKLNRHEIKYEIEVEPNKVKKFWEVWFKGGSFGQGEFEFFLTEVSAPLFLRLKKEFTQYRLSDIHQLKTGTSYKLYKLMKQHQHQRYWRVKIVDLKALLGVENKYPRWADFRKRALDKSVASINKLTDISITATPYRKGHAYAEIAFEIRVKTTESGVMEVITDRAKLEQALIDAGLHNKTAEKYSCLAEDAGKIETLAHKLPSILKRAERKPQAERCKYVTGAVSQEIRQLDILHAEKQATAKRSRQEMLACVKNYMGKSRCEKRERAQKEPAYKPRLKKCVLCFDDVDNNFFGGTE